MTTAGSHSDGYTGISIPHALLNDLLPQLLTSMHLPGLEEVIRQPGAVFIEHNVQTKLSMHPDTKKNQQAEQAMQHCHADTQDRQASSPGPLPIPGGRKCLLERPENILWTRTGSLAPGRWLPEKRDYRATAGSFLARMTLTGCPGVIDSVFLPARGWLYLIHPVGDSPSDIADKRRARGARGGLHTMHVAATVAGANARARQRNPLRRKARQPHWAWTIISRRSASQALLQVFDAMHVAHSIYKKRRAVIRNHQMVPSQ
ncbi:MAG TPA: hypothetical protein VGF67_24095 [Ktedonobacteraceae bacterium]|jgi:hypothetical protein